MTLEILICTYNERINQVHSVLMQPLHNISYLVSWQQSDGFAASAVPEALLRDDVKVVVTHSKGLSVNRNNALTHATGDVCLIADDDLTYIPNHVAHIIEVFESHPSLDVATFKYQSQSHPKEYPSFSFDLQKPPKGYYVTSFEIAFRRKSIQGNIRFNELFGLNAPLMACEEAVFMLDAIEKNLNCYFFPYVIARLDGPTTADKWATDPRYLMANGAYIYLAYKDGTAPLRYLLFAWRSSHHNPIKFFSALRYLLNGVDFIKKNSVGAK